jgi:type VI protein secretion system component Hcp
VTKVRKASPKLFLACTTGQHIKEAVLVGGVKEGKDRQEFFNVKLTDTYSPARTSKADQAVTYRPTSSA